MTKKQQPIASLEIKWEDGYFRSSLNSGAKLEEPQSAFVEEFCNVVNLILEKKGIKAPKIGILP